MKLNVVGPKQEIDKLRERLEPRFVNFMILYLSSYFYGEMKKRNFCTAFKKDKICTHIFHLIYSYI